MWNCTHFRHPTAEQLHTNIFVSNYYHLQSVCFELRYDQLAGHLPKQHVLSKIAPRPNAPEASVYRLRLVEEYQVSSRKKDQPLKLTKNDCQTFKSSFTSFESRIRWCGHWIPTVRSINLRKKALPGTITEQAKFNRPVRDCTSLKVAFLRRKNS